MIPNLAPPTVNTAASGDLRKLDLAGDLAGDSIRNNAAVGGSAFASFPAMLKDQLLQSMDIRPAGLAPPRAKDAGEAMEPVDELAPEAMPATLSALSPAPLAPAPFTGTPGGLAGALLAQSMAAGPVEAQAVLRQPGGENLPPAGNALPGAVDAPAALAAPGSGAQEAGKAIPLEPTIAPARGEAQPATPGEATPVAQPAGPVAKDVAGVAASQALQASLAPGLAIGTAQPGGGDAASKRPSPQAPAPAINPVQTPQPTTAPMPAADIPVEDPEAVAAESKPSPASASQSAAAQSSAGAAPLAQPQPAPVQASAPPVDPRSDLRAAPQLENTIEHLAQAREAGRSARGEMTMRHHEFGAINLRLEVVGGDLRAVLGSRDPAFVPAVQAALAERAIAPVQEASTARGGDQSNSQSNSQSNNQSNGHSNAGPGAHSEGRYGSSPGSGQASPQPYLDQTGPSDEDANAPPDPTRSQTGSGGTHAGGLFA